MTDDFQLPDDLQPRVRNLIAERDAADQSIRGHQSLRWTDTIAIAAGYMYIWWKILDSEIQLGGTARGLLYVAAVCLALGEHWLSVHMELQIAVGYYRLEVAEGLLNTLLPNGTSMHARRFSLFSPHSPWRLMDQNVRGVLWGLGLPLTVTPAVLGLLDLFGLNLVGQ